MKPVNSVNAQGELQRTIDVPRIIRHEPFMKCKNCGKENEIDFKLKDKRLF